MIVNDELERLKRDFATPDVECVFAFREVY
jgi:hypothetical protein